MPVNQPQLQVTIGGVAVPGAIFLGVESLAYFAADRFRVGFAIGAGAVSTTGFFAALDNAAITIEVAAGGGFAMLLSGRIDNIRINVRANIATLSGRDLTGQLIDTELSETFNNQTSSQIATTIAGRHGIAANVTPTSTRVGQYYELDHAHTALGLNSRLTTEWNLLTQLAQLEGFSLGLAGGILNFGPPVPAPPIAMSPQSTMSLEFDIAPTVPAAVTVKSWNSRNKMAVTQMAGTGGGNTLIRPNLTASQAQAMAASQLAALSRHTTILTATMPGDVTLLPAAQIALTGTGSALDQIYNVEAISRSIGAHRGFTQTIRAYAAA